MWGTSFKWAFITGSVVAGPFVSEAEQKRAAKPQPRRAAKDGQLNLYEAA